MENKENMFSGKLKGTLMSKSLQSNFQLKIGSIIDVKNLTVQTAVAPEVYTGKLVVIEVKEKGTTTSLKIKGKEPLILQDTYYVFKQGDTEMTCTASLSKIKENLGK